MEENNKKNLLKKLLDRLQEESWQLELLVSGFTIFGLFYARVPVDNALQKAFYEGDILADLYQTVSFAIDILIFNLIVHLVLRSLWIGALGLRSVSGDVDIYKLNYTKRFTNYLNKKIGSFDDYIEKLEKLCSIIFAISFLLIFYVAAYFLISQLITTLYFTNSYIILTISILLTVGAFLTFFDYLTQGLLKKNRWVAAIYFPFYWVFSFLTLSFLYRPLYYNLLDNKFGRRVSALLVPFYLSVLIISSFYKEQSGFIGYNSLSSNATIANNQNYEDVVEKEFYISNLAIQSKIINESYIKVKVPLTRRLEKHIMEFNESLKQYYDKRDYKSIISIGYNNSPLKINTDSIYQEYLKTFEKVYSIKIDSVLCKPDFVIAMENERLCFLTYIGTSNLAEGKHVLVYSKYKHPGNDSIITIQEIPFWYYKK